MVYKWGLEVTLPDPSPLPCQGLASARVRPTDTEDFSVLIWAWDLGATTSFQQGHHSR